eukprot:CAMPEP_0185495420 /NCGR_PEP_ID=MMETSP1366-20130426/17567_1 /TAXON_ID=38817 /ORGANISM="Gephyrocapsa oceanica, Strain RCC1303" /LENGTH=276 /DNA_ID=CAMNT_0028104431 /DNA_START=85 /DNA_END=913 /DNA_ORIENTATION=+
MDTQRTTNRPERSTPMPALSRSCSGLAACATRSQPKAPPPRCPVSPTRRTLAGSRAGSSARERAAPPVQRAHRRVVVGRHRAAAGRRAAKHAQEEAAPLLAQLVEQAAVGGAHRGRGRREVCAAQLCEKVWPRVEVGDVREVVKVAEGEPVAQGGGVVARVWRERGAVREAEGPRRGRPVDALLKERVPPLPPDKQLERGGKHRHVHAVELEEGHDGLCVRQQDHRGVPRQVRVLEAARVGVLGARKGEGAAPPTKLARLAACEAGCGGEGNVVGT